MNSIVVGAVIIAAVCCAALASANYDSSFIRRSTFTLSSDETGEGYRWMQTYGQTNLIYCGSGEPSRCSNFDTSTSPPTRVASRYTESYQWAVMQNALVNDRLFYYTYNDSSEAYGEIAEVLLSDMSSVANHSGFPNDYYEDEWYLAVLNDGVTNDIYAVAGYEYNSTGSYFNTNLFQIDVSNGGFTQVATFVTSDPNSYTSECEEFTIDSDSIYMYCEYEDNVLVQVARSFATTEKWIYTNQNPDFLVNDADNVYGASYETCCPDLDVGYIDRYSKSPFTFRGTIYVARQDGDTTIPGGYYNMALDLANGFAYTATLNAPYEMLKISLDTWSVVANVTSNATNDEGIALNVAVNSITGQVFAVDDYSYALAEFGPTTLGPITTVAAPNTTSAANSNAASSSGLTQGGQIGVGVGVSIFGLIVIAIIVVLLARKKATSESTGQV